MTVKPYGSPPESYASIAADLRAVLDGEACVEHEAHSLDQLLGFATPAIARRFCELGSALGDGAGQATSADILSCVAHDRNQHVIDLAVSASYPCYGLDRTLNQRGGHWSLHRHQVHYRADHNPNYNRSMVARALIAHVNKGAPPKFGDLRHEIDTPSESDASIHSMQVIIAPQIDSFLNIHPGMAVGADIIYYEPLQEAATGYAWMAETIDRHHELQFFLREIHDLSKHSAIPVSGRESALLKVAEFVRNERHTLGSIARSLWEAGKEFLD